MPVTCPLDLSIQFGPTTKRNLYPLPTGNAVDDYSFHTNTSGVSIHLGPIPLPSPHAIAVRLTANGVALPTGSLLDEVTDVMTNLAPLTSPVLGAFGISADEAVCAVNAYAVGLSTLTATGTPDFEGGYFDLTTVRIDATTARFGSISNNFELTGAVIQLTYMHKDEAQRDLIREQIARAGITVVDLGFK